MNPSDRKQTIIIYFLGTALLAAVASICYGTFAGKPIDVAAVQFAGTISGAFAALLTSRQTPPTPDKVQETTITQTQTDNP